MNQFLVNTKKLNFSYTKIRKEIENLELKGPKRSIYGFLGSNGSGKSNTIRLLLVLLKKHLGTLALFGEQFNSKTQTRSLEKDGALIENLILYLHLNAVVNLCFHQRFLNGVFILGSYRLFFFQLQLLASIFFSNFSIWILVRNVLF